MRKEFGAHEKPSTPVEPGPSGRLSPDVYFQQLIPEAHVLILRVH